FPLDVAKHILSAGDVEKLVKKADAGADIDAAQRAGVAADDHHRPRTALASDAHGDGIELRSHLPNHAIAVGGMSGQACEVANGLQDAVDAAVAVRINANAGTGKLSLQFGLRAIDH